VPFTFAEPRGPCAVLRTALAWQLDTDGDGLLSRDELHTGLANLGETISVEEMDTIVGLL
jgi:Ca2+-binding EF-hand superfamily protein